MHRNSSLIFSCSIALCFTAFSSQVSAKEYYKWVDSKGSTHYTTTPPPKNAKKQGKAETYGWSNSAPYNPNAAEKTEKGTPAQADKETSKTETQSSQPETKAPTSPATSGGPAV